MLFEIRSARMVLLAGSGNIPDHTERIAHLSKAGLQDSKAETPLVQQDLQGQCRETLRVLYFADARSCSSSACHPKALDLVAAHLKARLQVALSVPICSFRCGYCQGLTNSQHCGHSERGT